MRKFTLQQWTLAGLVLLAFMLRLGIALGHGVNAAPQPGTDPYEYDNYAWNVAQGRGYRGVSADVVDQDHLTAFRPPGTSLAWAGMYRVFGHRYDVIRIMNCAFGAFSIILVFVIGARCYGRKVAWMAALAYAVWPTALLFSSELLSEPIGTFCFLCFIAISLRFASEPRWWSAATAGLMLGYSILIRPNFTFMVPLAGLWVFWLFRKSTKYLIKGCLIPAMALLVLVPWTLRNYFVFHEFIPISTLSGAGLLMGNNRIVVTDPKYFGYSIWDTKIPEYREAIQSANDEVLRDRRARAFAIQWLKSNPDKWWFLARAKFVRAWTPFLQPQTPALYRIGMLVSWGPVLILFTLAFFPTLVTALKRHQPGLLLHIAIIEFMMITLIFWGETRYRHPVEPICLIWAAVTIVYVAGRAGWRWGRQAQQLASEKLPVTKEGALHS